MNMKEYPGPRLTLKFLGSDDKVSHHHSLKATGRIEPVVLHWLLTHHIDEDLNMFQSDTAAYGLFGCY